METQSNSKIRIKMGQIEVEFEGSESFLKKELPELLAAVSNLYNKTSLPENDVERGDKSTPQVEGEIQLTTSNIAAKINCKSGTDLVKASAAHLALVRRKNTFTRNEILSEMKSATSYYKQTYSSNLSSYLNTLTANDILRENTKDTFSLSANELEKLRNILG